MAAIIHKCNKKKTTKKKKKKKKKKKRINKTLHYPLISNYPFFCFEINNKIAFFLKIFFDFYSIKKKSLNVGITVM
jgi:hypothetical protein